MVDPPFMSVRDLRKGDAMGMNPKAWGRYRSLVREGMAPESAEANRFRARFRMAGDVTTVLFQTTSEATGLGYACGLRVALAYSALETLERAVRSESGGSIAKTPIEDSSLAERLRAQHMRKLAVLLQQEKAPRGKLLDGLITDFFAVGGDANVRPIAEKVRHLVFHGAFTAHGAGIVSGRQRQVLDDLAAAILAAADDRFTGWTIELEGLE